MNYCIRSDSLPGIGSYADAVEFWSTVTPWRGRNAENDERPLAKHRRNYMAVRKGLRDEFIFRFHNDDVVTWFPDKTVRLDVSWGSTSTTSFADRLTPAGVWADSRHRHISTNVPTDYAVRKHKHLRRWRDDLHALEAAYEPQKDNSYYTPNWWFMRTSVPDGLVWLKPSSTGYIRDFDGPLVPFTKYMLNRQKTREILADTGYAQFRSWAKAHDALTPSKPDTRPLWRRWSEPAPTYEPLAELLAEKEWAELRGTHRKLDTILRTLRHQLYDGEGVVEEHDVWATHNWSGTTNIEAGYRKYRGLL